MSRKISKRLRDIRLNSIKTLLIQVDQGLQSNIEVQRTHPDRLANIETWLRLAADEAKLIREEDQVGIGYWQEISEALPLAISRINDELLVRQNMDFIQATDKAHLIRFLEYVLKYGSELFVQVLEEMSDEDHAKVEDMVDKARRD